jgi:hypothetical protein
MASRAGVRAPRATQATARSTPACQTVVARPMPAVKTAVSRYPPRASWTRWVGWLARGPLTSLARPSRASESPSMSPRVAADPRSTPVRKAGRTAVAISWPASLKKLAAPMLATSGETQGGYRSVGPGVGRGVPPLMSLVPRRLTQRAGRRPAGRRLLMACCRRRLPAPDLEERRRCAGRSPRRSWSEAVRLRRVGRYGGRRAAARPAGTGPSPAPAGRTRWRGRTGGSQRTPRRRCRGGRGRPGGRSWSPRARWSPRTTAHAAANNSLRRKRSHDGRPTVSGGGAGLRRSVRLSDW